jgi:Protein of unknown function (DUF1580)
MIDIQTETLIPIAKVPSHLPDRIHIATVWRWVNRGCRKVKLVTVLIGGRRYTSLEQLQAFVERTTAAADGDSLPIASTPSHRRRAHEKACRELDEAGI